MKSKNSRIIALFILFCLPLSMTFSASDTKTDAEKWIIAPQNFGGKIEYQQIVPNLILQSFPENISRKITPEEQEKYRLEKLNSKIQSLTSDLVKQQAAKDQLFFSNSDKSSKNKERAKIDEKIKKINEEILQLQEELQKSVEYVDENREIQISTNFVKDNFFTSEKSKNQNINAVLSGNVYEQNGFLFIKAKISILPLEYSTENSTYEGIFSMETSAVGNYSEIQRMTSEIAQNFLSFLMNKEKITVSVKVFPEEIVSNVSITIDGTTYKNQVEKLILQQGEHKFSIEAPNYQSRNFSAYLDDSNKIYNYTVYLSPIEKQKIEIFGNDKELLEKDINIEEVSLYVGGIKQSIVFSDDELKAAYFANHLPVFGEFTVPLVTGSEEDKKYASTFFRLTGDSIKPITIRSDSSTVLIEKARKRMYTSYGILLTTLPLSFYANGRLTDIVNTINSGNNSDEMFKKYENWLLTYQISLGTTITAGINMLIQLGRYIYTANTVLPQNR